MLREIIKKEIAEITGLEDVKILEPEREEHGDYSTNVAFKIGKAEELAEKLKKSRFVKDVAVKNKFINIFVKDETLLEILSQKIELPKKKEKINVEFVSANPTGPLTMANGRGGFYGDALSNVLEKLGYDVTREYFVNDAGNQIKLLGRSVLAEFDKKFQDPMNYVGAYIKGIAVTLGRGKIKFDNVENNLESIGRKAADTLLKRIKTSLDKAKIKFDVWFYEDRDLRKTGELEKILELLEAKTEKREGALWLENWVLKKSDGEPTYLLSDFAYHYNKFVKRKFDVVIDIWGADHQGHVEPLIKGIEFLGIDAERLKIIIMQLVRLVSKGKEVAMSKRTGEFITLDELLNEVGLDVARWFFLEKSPNTHMDFDLDLAKERSEKNPVYYVQYAYVRMQGILRKTQIPNSKFQTKEFRHPSERTLAMKILRYPEILEDISKDYQVHRLTTYAYELAQTFSAFYRDVKVIGSEREPELLYLVSKTKETLADLLKLMGISQPEKM